MAQEVRLIDANALLDANMYGNTAPITHRTYAEILIQKAPTVDAVPVVYCKDCARCKKGYCTIRKDSWGATLLVGQHDYCSDGERRTDNG